MAAFGELLAELRRDKKMTQAGAGTHKDVCGSALALPAQKPAKIPDIRQDYRKFFRLFVSKGRWQNSKGPTREQ